MIYFLIRMTDLWSAQPKDKILKICRKQTYLLAIALLISHTENVIYMVYFKYMYVFVFFVLFFLADV